MNRDKTVHTRVNEKEYEAFVLAAKTDGDIPLSIWIRKTLRIAAESELVLANEPVAFKDKKNGK